jgi:hypothetical protein
MSKKPTKSKAKRSRAKPLRIPRDPVTGQQFLFNPATGKPTYSAPRLSAAQVERIKRRESERVRTAREAYAARKAARITAIRARLARRPAEMRRDSYEMPADVSAFLHQLHEDPGSYGDEEPISIEQSLEWVKEAYMEGCRQGFIEGFLYGEDKARPGALKNRERLRQINIDKLVRLGIADRNAEIVAEFHRLERELPGKEQRKEKLAADHDLTPKQIGNILRADKRRQ